MSQVGALLQFILVIPATNATSGDHSFTALRHLKYDISKSTDLCTTMLQECLNYYDVASHSQEDNIQNDSDAVITAMWVFYYRNVICIAGSVGGN